MDSTSNALPDACRDIPLPPGCYSVEKVEKGWSKESKFLITAAGGRRYLLRVRDGSRADSHRQEFDFVLALYRRGISVPKPFAFGPANGGESSYMLLEWVEGTELEDALPLQTRDKQYQLGLSAGQLLKAIHQTPVSPCMHPARSMKDKALRKIGRFEASNLRVDKSESLVAFIRQNIDCLGSCPPVCLHGDFHPGNLILKPQGKLAAIDFNRWDIGDPVEEFYKLQSFTIESSVPFACGQLDGYFDGTVPQTFWKSLAVHVAVSSLYSILWATSYGQEEERGMIRRCERAIQDYHGFSRGIPAWYAKQTD